MKKLYKDMTSAELQAEKAELEKGTTTLRQKASNLI